MYPRMYRRLFSFFLPLPVGARGDRLFANAADVVPEKRITGGFFVGVRSAKKFFGVPNVIIKLI